MVWQLDITYPKFAQFKVMLVTSNIGRTNIRPKGLAKRISNGYSFCVTEAGRIELALTLSISSTKQPALKKKQRTI
jgi:hypothetical protein